MRFHYSIIIILFPLLRLLICFIILLLFPFFVGYTLNAQRVYFFFGKREKTKNTLHVFCCKNHLYFLGQVISYCATNLLKEQTRS